MLHSSTESATSAHHDQRSQSWSGEIQAPNAPTPLQCALNREFIPGQACTAPCSNTVSIRLEQGVQSWSARHTRQCAEPASQQLIACGRLSMHCKSPQARGPFHISHSTARALPAVLWLRPCTYAQSGQASKAPTPYQTGHLPLQSPHESGLHAQAAVAKSSHIIIQLAQPEAGEVPA